MLVVLQTSICSLLRIEQYLNRDFIAVALLQAKIKAAKERAAFNMRLSSLRGESKLVEKEAIAARRAARNPLRKIET